MIKKLFLTAFISLFIITLAQVAFCDDAATKFDNAATKLGRGLCNMLTFPLEVPEQISRVNNLDGPFAASTVGLLKGFGWAIGRACVGIYETATFMMPYPDNYKPILRDPEYFMDTSNF